MHKDEKIVVLKKHWEENNIPNISFQTVELLEKIILKNNYKNILEVGTANGFSSICFAKILQNSGKITTIEFSKLAHEAAKKNFEDFGVSEIIDAKLGNAIDIIPTLEQKYDFVFIDGMKKRSLDFFLLAQEKILPGATIIVDDVIKFRHKMENFYEYLAEKNISYDIIEVDGDDGIMIIQM